MRKFPRARAWRGIAFLLLAMPAAGLAFGSAAHLVIAAGVFPGCRTADLFFGSIAPDIATLAGLGGGAWASAFQDTHYGAVNLLPCARDAQQRRFAAGWLTHNEAWGADFDAHIRNPLGGDEGYVVGKARQVLSQYGPITGDDARDLELAHLLVEAAIDLLLTEALPALPATLLQAAAGRSPEDVRVLGRALVWGGGRTTGLDDLVTAETAFRAFTCLYAVALGTSTTDDPGALAQLGLLVASVGYGIDVSASEAVTLLHLALDLCRDDCDDVICASIARIASTLRQRRQSARRSSTPAVARHSTVSAAP